jgi:pentatricopeptide repeat protein
MKQRNIVTWNSVIIGYEKRREMAKARNLIDEMPERDVVSWNLMISGYISCRGSRYIEEGRSLFDQTPVRDCVSWNTRIDRTMDGDGSPRQLNKLMHYAAVNVKIIVEPLSCVINAKW